MRPGLNPRVASDLGDACSQTARQSSPGCVLLWWQGLRLALAALRRDSEPSHTRHKQHLESGKQKQGALKAEEGALKVEEGALTAEEGALTAFTSEQRFFLSWAQLWREVASPQKVSQKLTLDAHGPNEFRVVGPMVNMPEFYEAFGVQRGDAMWRDPDDRVSIW